MPFFEIQHHLPLGPHQREQLAKAFTNLHATTFNAPSLFVNIRFINLDFNGDEDYFYGGERRPRTNRIFVHIRSGAGRNYEKYAEEIERLWDEIVGGGYKKMYKLEKEKEGIKDDRKEGERFKEEHIKLLQGVFIIPGLTAREEGFAIPQAGEEKAWLAANWKRFEERSEHGDEDITALIKEVNGRTELGGKGKNEEEKQKEREEAGEEDKSEDAPKEKTVSLNQKEA